MFKNDKQLYASLLGQRLMYRDKETGIAWEIEVFEVFRSRERDALVLILTDYVTVELTFVDRMFGFSGIVDKITKSYAKAMANLEYIK